MKVVHLLPCPLRQDLTMLCRLALNSCLSLVLRAGTTGMRHKTWLSGNLANTFFLILAVCQVSC